MKRTARSVPVDLELGWVARAALLLARGLERPLRWRGVDPRQFRRLLEVEFAVSERRGKRARSEGEGGQIHASATLGFVVNALIAVVGSFALTIDDPLWGMAVPLFMLQVFLVMMLVGEYLPMFLETADISVLAAMPVADRTVIAARIAHVTAFVGSTVVAMSIAPLVVGTVHYGPVFVPVWIVASLLSAISAVGLALGLFVLALRYLNVDRFRDALLYVQIGAMVTVFGGFQLLPRVFDLGKLTTMVDVRSWLMLVAPPFHGSALLALMEADRSPLTFALAALAVGVPAVVFFVLLGSIGDGFVARLVGLKSAAQGGREPRVRNNRCLQRLLATSTTRAGYDFFAALSRRERSFRMRAYPLVAMSCVIGIAMTFRHGELRDPRMLSGTIYLLGMYAPGVVMVARFSDDFEARWLFTVAPMRAPGEFLVGSLISMLATFTLPAVGLLAMLSIAIGGFAIVPDVVFAALVVIAVTIVAMCLLGRSIPFTERVQKSPGGASFGIYMSMMFVTGVGIVAHLLLRQFDVAFYAVLALLPLASVWLLRALRRVAPNVPWLGPSPD